MNYYNKYLKYKIKYLQLKLIGGGNNNSKNIKIIITVPHFKPIKTIANGQRNHDMMANLFAYKLSKLFVNYDVSIIKIKSIKRYM